MNKIDTSESEDEPRTYAAVVAQPGTAASATTPPTEGRPQPPGPPGPRPQSPVAGWSGLQQLNVQPARSSKKRKRELPKPEPTIMVDSEEEGTGTDNDSTVLRSNRLMQMEMSNLASRAVQLQMSLEEYQQGLGELTNLLEHKYENMKIISWKYCSIYWFLKAFTI